MTREEAIEAIKCNWPDSRYTILREALDMAISALRQQNVSGKDVGKMTNADRIRAMTDEELVNFLMRLMGHAQCFAEGIFPYHPCPQNHNCKQCGIDWLQQPCGEEDKYEVD